MSHLRIFAPLVFLRPRPAPFSCIRGIATPVQYSTTTSPSTTTKKTNIPLRSKVLPVRINELAADWWRARDHEYGTEWTARLPPDARATAESMRELLDAWPNALREENGDRWVQFALEKREHLRVSYKALFARLDAGKVVVQQIESIYNRLLGEAKALRNVADTMLRHHQRVQRMQQEFGIKYEVALSILEISHATRARENIQSRFRTRCHKALRKSEQIAVCVELLLARLRWYDELEEEHGDKWADLAEGNNSRWTLRWYRSSPEAFSSEECSTALDVARQLVTSTQRSLDKLKWFDALEREHGHAWAQVADKMIFEWYVLGGHLNPEQQSKLSSSSGFGRAEPATAQTVAPSATLLPPWQLQRSLEA